MSDIIDYSSMRRGGASAVSASVSTDPIQRILTGRHLPSDVKSQFADKTLRRRIISKSNELLRQLKVRVRTKVNKHDSDETRAAVVLEFVLRTGSATLSSGRNSDEAIESNSILTRAVPIDVLAMQLGARKQYVEEVQSALGHYLQEITSDVGTRGGASTTAVAEQTSADTYNQHSILRPHRSGMSETTAVAEAAVKSQPKGTSEIIRDLSIRLGSLVPDADGSARRGEALFAALGQNIVDSGDHHRDARLSDFKRNKVAYEAACFYVCANEGEGGGKKHGSGKSKSATVNGSGEVQLDEKEECALSMADVGNAARLNMKTFETIAREVAKVAAEIKSSRAATAEKTREKRQQGQKRAYAKKRQRGGTTGTKLKNHFEMSNLSDSESICDLKGKNKVERYPNSSGERLEGELRGPPRRPAFPAAFTPSAEFLAWKRQILNDAIKRARENSDKGKELSKHEALELAANNIIAHP